MAKKRKPNKRASAPDGYITTGELADLLGINEQTMRIYRHQKKGPNYTKVKMNGRIIYAIEDVKKWAKDNGIVIGILE